MGLFQVLLVFLRFEVLLEEILHLRDLLELLSVEVESGRLDFDQLVLNTHSLGNVTQNQKLGLFLGETEAVGNQGVVLGLLLNQFCLDCLYRIGGELGEFLYFLNELIARLDVALNDLLNRTEELVIDVEFSADRLVLGLESLSDRYVDNHISEELPC